MFGYGTTFLLFLFSFLCSECHFLFANVLCVSFSFQCHICPFYSRAILEPYFIVSCLFLFSTTSYLLYTSVWLLQMTKKKCNDSAKKLQLKCEKKWDTDANSVVFVRRLFLQHLSSLSLLVILLLLLHPTLRTWASVAIQQ